ncbi:MAG: hypothetical protein HYS81_05100 [Candidatus Aenigmatarchaeota archaeon]|nr:MAG: hypothetical protein HYS81_05100 [Candidatus Aenigmarchaeota archaeon]
MVGAFIASGGNGRNRNSRVEQPCLATIAQIDDRGRIFLPAMLRKRLGIERDAAFMLILDPDGFLVLMPTTREGK